MKKLLGIRDQNWWWSKLW